MPKNDVALPEKAEVIRDNGYQPPVEFGYAGPGVDFQTLAEEAIVLPGHDLAKDDVLDSLVGVDFIITRLNYRLGIPRREDNIWLKQNSANRNAAYVSVEVTTNPYLMLSNVNRGRTASKLNSLVSLDGLGFDPGDNFVFNDGSTGIYRQVTAFLGMTGYITLPDGATEGPSGQTICDTIPDEWPEVHVGEIRFDATGFATYTANVRLRCKRGIRISDYESEFNPDSKTRYLAA